MTTAIDYLYIVQPDPINGLIVLKNANTPRICMTTPKTHTNIAVDWHTHARLKRLGTAGDSLCDVIKSMLDEREKERSLSQQQQQNAQVQPLQQLQQPTTTVTEVPIG